MLKIWAKICVFSVVTFGLVIPVAIAPSAHAGFQTLQYCGISFNRNVSIQPSLSNPAFTYETYFALAYDSANSANTHGSNAEFPNNAGGVLLSPHTTLLGSADTTGGLEIYYNTAYLRGDLLIFMGRPGGKYTYFTNPAWKFPQFTKSQGSSDYVHLAVVRDVAGRLSVFFQGLGPTSYYQVQGEGGSAYTPGNSVVDPNVYGFVNYIGASGRFTTDVNPKQNISNVRLVTGAALYDPTKTTLEVPSVSSMRLNAQSGTTEVLLNSLSPSGIVTNDASPTQSNASFYNFGGNAIQIANQVAAGSACSNTASDMYIGGVGTYNVYFADGNTASSSGVLPTKQFFDSNATPLTSITLPANTMSKTGNYAFAGWNSAADGTGTTYLPGSTFTPTGNTTLYTTWVPTYGVTYALGGGTGTLPTQVAVASGATFVLANNTLTKANSIFNGWSDGTTSYAAGQNYTMGGSAKTLTAQWVAGYNLTYMANSATSGSVPSPQRFTTPGGTALTISSNSGSLVRTGYTFGGWNSAADGTGTLYTVGQTGVSLSADLTLHAKWSANTYTLSYAANGATSGTVPSTQSYTTGGSTLTLGGNPGTLIRTGYTFAGWNSAADGSGTNYTDSQTGITIANDITLYAKWTANIAYQLKFDGAGAISGTVPSPLTYTSGGPALTLPGNSGNLVLTGSTFQGWGFNVSGIFTPVSTYSTASAATIYAIWFREAFTVTFNANGGSGSMAVQERSANTNLTANTLTLTNNDFVGWNSAVDGSGTSYSDGQAYPFVVSTTLYAQWGKVISYSANGAVSGAPSRTRDSWNSGAISLPTVGTLAKAGYTFGGWSDGTTTYISTYTPTAGITLNPVWTPNSYTITFNKNGATGGIVPTDQTWTQSTTPLTLSVNPGSLVKAGYTFGGWAVSASSSASVTTFSSTLASSTQIRYAIWIPIPYTVTYVLSDGTSVLPTQTSLEIGGTFTTAATPTRSTYVFGGWSDGTSTYGARSIYTIGTSNVTLTAQWIATYTIHYLMNGSSNSATPDAIYNSGTLINAATAPTRAGYTFGGWLASNSNSYVAGASFSVLSDSTLTAQWTPIAYSVTYELGGGTSTLPTQASQNIANAFIMAAAPIRVGYNFNGWSDGTNNYGAGASYTVGTSNITLTAQWSIISFTITYDLNGGVGTRPTQSNKNISNTFTLPTSASNPTKLANVFAGWSDGNVTYAAGSTYTVGTSNVTLTAIWIQNGYTTITYSLGGGTGELPTRAPLLEGLSFEVTNSIPIRPGFTFAGWSDGRQTYLYDAFITVPNVAFPMTLTAEWSAIAYPVTYDLDGGTSTLPSQTDVTSGKTFLIAVAPTQTGYIFTGWSDGIDTYSAGTTYSVAASAVRLQAKWVRGRTVTYLAGTSTGIAPEDTTLRATGTIFVLPSSGSLTKSGYTFSGWSDGANNYLAGATYTCGSSNVTLTAQWSTIAAPSVPTPAPPVAVPPVAVPPVAVPPVANPVDFEAVKKAKDNAELIKKILKENPQDRAAQSAKDTTLDLFNDGSLTNSKLLVTSSDKGINLVDNKLVSNVSVPPEVVRSLIKKVSITIVGGSVVLKPLNGFTGIILVPVLGTINGVQSVIVNKVAVNPESVITAQSVVRIGLKTDISWSPSTSVGVRYQVIRNGVVICETVLTSCTFPSLIGPKSNMSVVVFGNDNTLSGVTEINYGAKAPIPALTVAFALNSAVLSSPQKVELRKVAGIVAREGFTRLVVSGYTDVQGNIKANKILSGKRASVTAAFLKPLLSKISVTTSGFGAISPIRIGNTEADYAANRRCEIAVW